VKAGSEKGKKPSGDDLKKSTKKTEEKK